MAVKHTFTSTIEDGADDTLVQPSDWNAEHVLSNALGAIDALTPAASKIPYFNGADSATLADITATGVSLLGAANAAGARTTLELGTVATQAADNVSLTGGSISGMTSISGSTLTSTVVTGTAPFSVTSTTLVANLNTDTVDGFHASQTPGANQIPVLNSSGRLVLDGTDDGSSKIQTGGNIKAGNNILIGGELIGPSSLKIHPNTSDGADSGVSCVCGGGWPQPSRGGFLEARGNESASYPGDVRIISGGDSTFGNVSLLTGGGYERFRITPSGRILAGPTLPTDNGVDALQVNGSVSLVGNLSIKNIYGAGLAVNNYSGANSIGENIWIGGGGTSSIGESGATYKGSCNFAAGTSALNSTTTAYWNTASGYASLYGITTGHSNTAAGYTAGRFIAGGSVLNTISTGSLYLGAATKAGADGNTNEIVIGFNTTGMGSNTAILGNSNITHTYLRGRILAGPTLPTDNGVDALQINGSIIAASTEKSIKLDPTTNLPAITITSADLGQVHLYMGGASNPATAGISFSDNARKLWFRTESTERLAILQSGRILAGPIIPTDNGVDALQVNGTIASKGYKLSALNTAPASASAAGTLGEIRITADAIYICTATNTWKKVAIATW